MSVFRFIELTMLQFIFIIFSRIVIVLNKSHQIFRQGVSPSAIKWRDILSLSTLPVSCIVCLSQYSFLIFLLLISFHTWLEDENLFLNLVAFLVIKLGQEENYNSFFMLEITTCELGHKMENRVPQEKGTEILCFFMKPQLLFQLF